MKRSGLRQARVSTLLRETLSEILMRKVKDPRVATVTITDVEVSHDLKVAHVFFCLADKAGAADALKGLTSAQGFFRHELRGVLSLKYVPELIFMYDKSFDYGTKIDTLLMKIKIDEEKNS